MARLISLELDRGKVLDWEAYPFTVPAIRTLGRIEVHSPVLFLAGENGSGKSTLLEAIADHYGFGLEGGNRNTRFSTTASSSAIQPLRQALRIAFSKRTGRGFFLRAESFFNLASYVDEMDVSFAYGGQSLHKQSHGESFFSFLDSRIQSRGLYLMDEPEAALSPQRQLAVLALLHRAAKNVSEVQFVVATHSPILLAYPGAQILSFDEGNVHEITYRQTQSFQFFSKFLAEPERYLHYLFRDEQG